MDDEECRIEREGKERSVRGELSINVDVKTSTPKDEVSFIAL